MYMAPFHSDKLPNQIHLFVSDELTSAFRGMAGDSGLSVSELIRRSMKYICKNKILDEVVPEISGFTDKYQIH